MDEYKCIYCKFTTQDFCTIINHCSQLHEDKNVKINISNYNAERHKITSYSKDFRIIPRDINLLKKILIPKNETKTIRISNLPEASPLKKIQKVSTPMKDIHQTFESRPEQTDEIVRYIPDVLEYLRTENQIDVYLKFHKLLAEQKLPLSNIAYLLFLDVVRWFSMSSTRVMKYSDDVKRFWRIGLLLFKGKFIRYMSGWKNKGQDIKGAYRAEDSVINFAVPSRSCLEESPFACKLKDSRPGVFDEMIKLLNEEDVGQNKTFKLCVDGKKINQGKQSTKFGDVDLWGHEASPTLYEKMDRLEKDNLMINEFSKIIENVYEKDYQSINELTESVKRRIAESGRDILKLLSGWVKELRIVKQKKNLTLEKIKLSCTTELIRQKFSYAMSALRTYIYQINACISRLLQAIDSLGAMIAVCNEAGTMYKTGRSCDMSLKENYMCLSGPETIDGLNLNDVNTSMLKQRSSAWFEVRKLAKVTGSTCNAAIGLSGLKQQKEHFEQVFNKKEKDQPTEDVEKRLRHGTENEIHAVATLVCKVLPVYEPDAMYVEEGCEVIKVGDDGVPIVVSPDGSIRKITEEVNIITAAVEIKCPYPGKLYTTPVYYEIPWYYATQVILEMKALNIDQLYFLCYSDESTTVFKVPFDNELWVYISKCVVTLYGKNEPASPKKLLPETSVLKEKVQRFCKERDQFMVEFPSVKATRTCNHLDISSKSEEVGLTAKTKQQTQLVLRKMVLLLKY